MEYDESDYEENLRDDDLEYTKKSEFSKAEIVKDAIKKVEDTRCQEMKEGYYNYSTSPNGDTKKIYIPDTRKVFIGAVECLRCILKPEIERDGRMQKVLIKFKEKKDKLFEKYSVKIIIEDNHKIILLDEKYIPEIDELIPVMVSEIDNRRRETGRKGIDYKKGIYNFNVRRYWDDIVKLYDYMFEELNVLIASKKVNFFKQGASY